MAVEIISGSFVTLEIEGQVHCIAEYNIPQCVLKLHILANVKGSSLLQK